MYAYTEIMTQIPYVTIIQWSLLITSLGMTQPSYNKVIFLVPAPCIHLFPDIKKKKKLIITR